MEIQSNISSYLVRPRLTNRRRSLLLSLKIRWRLLSTAHPKLTRRSLAGVAIWVLLNGLAQFLLNLNPTLSNNGALAGTSSESPAPVANLAVASSPINLAPPPNVTAAHTLPGGPTGQLLPPGTMAPYGTYFNTYTRGQCTWYVASRRPIPSGWGNAVAWYYHATASGWRVGTTPAVAAIAWTSAGAYGHVALVENISNDHRQVYIAEMNYNGGVGVVNHRWVSATSFRYIY